LVRQRQYHDQEPTDQAYHYWAISYHQPGPLHALEQNGVGAAFGLTQEVQDKLSWLRQCELPIPTLAYELANLIEQHLMQREKL
jgi:hypothetical protein